MDIARWIGRGAGEKGQPAKKRDGKRLTGGVSPHDHEAVSRWGGEMSPAPTGEDAGATWKQFRGGWKWCVAGLFFWQISFTILGERYLTVDQAQKTCFPEATQFDERTLRLTREEKQQIEKRAGIAVRKDEVKYWHARKGDVDLGILVVDQVMGKHDLIDYAVAISPAGKVLQVELLEYREKYGVEIRSPKWREQFAGKTTESPLHLDEDVYNISGATISCRHVTQGIKRVLATRQIILDRERGGAGELPKPAAK